MDKMNKINGHDVEYIVNGNTVVAIIRGCSNDVIDHIETQHDIYTMRNSVVDTLYTPHNLRGVAKCNPEDEFNLEVGKRIAYRRLQVKYWDKFSMRLTKFSILLTGIQNRLLTDIGKSANKFMKVNPLEGVTE